MQLRSHLLQQEIGLFVIDCLSHLRNSSRIDAVPLGCYLIVINEAALCLRPESAEAEQAQRDGRSTSKHSVGIPIVGTFIIAAYGPVGRHTNLVLRRSAQEVETVALMMVSIECSCTLFICPSKRVSHINPGQLSLIVSHDITYGLLCL